MLETVLDRVEVNARWAPITSLLSRETSAPVWVRVKNASDIRCTWREDPGAQVVDQPLADPGGEPALAERRAPASTTATAAIAERQPRRPARVSCLRMPSSTMLLDQQRGDHDQRRRRRR